jgi:hypothetical protein
MRSRFQQILRQKKKEAKMEQYNERQSKFGLNPNLPPKKKTEFTTKHEFQHKKDEVEEPATAEKHEDVP